MKNLFTVKEASLWASQYLKKNITTSNISYLTQYGKINKYNRNGYPKIDKKELIIYYQNLNREIDWKKKLGKDLNWKLSFDFLKEKETTKHVHRIHPYKGKFIPQLVEYFLDDHLDEFKKEIYFQKNNIVLDPFCGSGTTLIQANELGIHAIGSDISSFNALISNVKLAKVDFEDLQKELQKITFHFEEFISKNENISFESELLEQLNIFNKKYFPSPEYKIKVRQQKINEKKYSFEKEQEFLTIFYSLQKKYNLEIKNKNANNFLQKWYLKPIQKEIDFVFEQLKKVENETTKKIITVLLSRTIRSCRATTHADLTTLKKTITATYYCRKHGKICKPLFSMFSWWQRYSKDIMKRFLEFEKVKTNTFQYCLQGDGRKINLIEEISKKNISFSGLLKKQKINGIFSSPPYVGLINYHEQHAYAYDLFGFKRNDHLEIGSLFRGQGREARNSYVEGISQVLKNSKKYLQKDYHVFLVANDKYNLYPTIAEKAGMEIVNQYKRPVLNRTEKDKGAYAEIVFHMKEKGR